MVRRVILLANENLSIRYILEYRCVGLTIVTVLTFIGVFLVRTTHRECRRQYSRNNEMLKHITGGRQRHQSNFPSCRYFH